MQSIRKTTLALLLAAQVLWPVSSLAQGGAAGRTTAQSPAGNALSVALTVSKVTLDAAGKEALVDAGQARPGDLLEYRAEYVNISGRPLNDVAATLPIPSSTVYQPKSASPQAVLASASGGDYAAEPLMRRVRGADGLEKLEPVPLAEYRSLRWKFRTIDANRSVSVSARVRVAGPDPVSAPAAASAAASAASPASPAAPTRSPAAQ